VTRLRTSDLHGALEFVGELNETDAPEPFPAELLGRLAALVPADSAAYNERDLAGRELLFASEWCRDEEGIEPDVADWDLDPSGIDAWEYVLHHPVNVFRRRSGYMGALADSEIWERRERRSHDVFGPEYHAYWGLVDCLGIRLSDSSTHTLTVWLESRDRDFSARDKLVLDVLRPHLAARRRHARLWQLLADVLSALDAAPEQAPAVVLLAESGRVEFASAAARVLLREYFGKSGAVLPEPLEVWRRAGTTTSYRVRRDGHSLVVDAAGRGQSALVLREEPTQLAALTVRELDVMRYVDAGLTNDEIARLLWITRGTVKKHLEHVYAKLGVRTRTAALARLRPRVAAGVSRD
jgi:DNA-binding CsgD family transcriptional regulator